MSGSLINSKDTGGICARFTIANGRMAKMNILADPDRRCQLDLSAIER